MCKAVEEFAERRAAEARVEAKAEGKAEGIAEGKRETMLAMAKRMLKDGILALKDIAKRADWDGYHCQVERHA